MKILAVIDVHRCDIVCIQVLILLFASVVVMASSSPAAIEAHCLCCDGDLISCTDACQVWHQHGCQKNGVIGGHSSDRQYTPDQNVRNILQHCAACYAESSTASEPIKDRDELKILVPLYIYPDLHADDSRWKAVAEAQSKVDITAIINPNNGPLRSPSEPSYGDYQRGLQTLRDANVKVLGYVHTSYTKRDPKKIKEDIDQYARYYDVDGIFFDEASNRAEDKNFYAQLTAYVRTAPRLKTVVLNPGIATAPAYIDAQRSVADTAVTFEQTYAHWIKVSGPPNWVYRKTANRFALLVHTAPDIAAMKRSIDLGHSRHYGYVYVTHDMGANPWDTLPSYWQEMVDYIKQLNETRVTRHPDPITRFVNFFTGNRFTP